MNKVIVPSANYTFAPSTGIITISGAAYTSLVNSEGVLLVTNITDNIIIYNPYCDGFGGTVNSTAFTITLEYDTVGMNATDELQIVLYDGTTQTVFIDDNGGSITVDGAIDSAIYTEGDTDTTIQGVPMMWEDSGNTLRVPSTSNALPIEQHYNGTSAETNTGNANNGTQRVVLADNQPAVDVNLQDGAGTDITSTLVGADQALDVNVVQSPTATTTFADDGTIDAFGRLRVSGTGQRLDVEFLYNKQPDYFDEVTSGTGTVTHNANQRHVVLATGGVSESPEAALYSYPVPYTPGNSQLIEMTGVLDFTAILGGTAEVFVRTNTSGTPTEDTFDQSTWNNFTSGVSWQYSQIFAMDFQSLKVGRIRFGIVRNGDFTLVKEVNNDDIRNGGYWQLANQPCYYRIYLDSGNTVMEIGYGNTNNAIGFRYKVTQNAVASMTAICCTVKSEGGTDLRELPGLPAAADMGVTVKTVSTTLIPLLSIQPNATFNSLENMIIAIPKGYTVETDNPIRLDFYTNASLTGASFTAVNANESMMNVDTTASAISGGKKIGSVYVSSAGRNTASSIQGLLGKAVLWDRQSTLAGINGILTIAAVRTGGTNADVLVGIDWEEIR